MPTRAAKGAPKSRVMYLCVVQEAAPAGLLAFASPGREAAFEKRFHAARLPLDRVYLTTIVSCNVALLLLKMAPIGRWGTAALLLADSLPAAVLLAWQRARRESYLCHRTPLIATLHLVHAMVRRGAGHVSLGHAAITP